MTKTKGVRLHDTAEYQLWEKFDELQRVVDTATLPDEDDVREWRIKVYKIMHPKRLQYLSYAIEAYNELVRDFDRILLGQDMNNKGGVSE